MSGRLACVGFLLLASAGQLGCGAILGLESEYEVDSAPGSGAGGAGQAGSEQGGAGQGGQGGAGQGGQAAGEAGAAGAGAGGAGSGGAGQGGSGQGGAGEGGAGAGGDAGQGGAAGAAPECVKDEGCKQPPEPCKKAICDAGKCVEAPLDEGTTLVDPTPKDCQREVCDGKGATRTEADPADLPDDGDPCTDDLCDKGKPSNPPSVPGTSCDKSLVCDGKGGCVVCVPGSKRCSDKGEVETCDDQGGAWSTGAACTNGFSCVEGSCECASNFLCGDQCVDPATDASNCGACGAACAQGGGCCGGACADLQNDPFNCGSCGQICPVACSAGKCVTVVDVELGGGNSYAAPICAIFSDKTVRCITDNDMASWFPTSAASAKHIPWYVEGLPKVKSLAINGYGASKHACAVLDTNQTVCTGQNAYGELGNGSTDPAVAFVPTQLAPTVALQRVTTSYFASGALVGGKLFAWGYNASDYFGLGTGDQKVSTPTQSLSQPEPFEDIQGGSGSVFCARTAQGKLYSWGDNGYGTLGRGDPAVGPLSPGLVPLGDVAELSLKHFHACAVVKAAQTSEVYCWGYNATGQAGADVDSATNIFNPVKVAQGVSVSTGTGHTCVLQANGQVTCWGQNGLGQLGRGNYISSTKPQLIAGLPVVKKIALGGDTSCAITQDGKLHCWGFLYLSTTSPNPKQILFPALP